MQDTYYVQTQARRIMKCIYPENLPNGKVSPEYLRGLEEERFWIACGELRGIFADYYARAEKAPASLNLPLYEIEKYRNTSSEAREGNAALINFPAALLALGECAELSGDTLVADINAFRKSFSDLKCKYLPKQLNILTDYGFTFDGFNGKTLPKAGTLNVSYPDNSDLLVVLAAAGDKLGKYMPLYLKQPKSGWGLNLLEQFIYLTPAVFADNTENLPPKSLEHMASAIGGEYRDILFKLAVKFKERGLELHFDTAFLKNRFFNQKGKDTLNHLEYGDYRNIWQDGNEQLFLRLKLNNPDAYIEEIKALPPHLMKTFTDTWCANCAEKCNRRIVYHLDGEEKRACGCFFFAYKNPSEDDVDNLMVLYDLEQKVRAKK